MLKEIKFIQNVGRFETARPASSAVLLRCALIFGENGWGKSTFADILRSLTNNQPEIVKGRLTLPSGNDQKIVLRFENGSCILENGRWQGGHPSIAVYDSVFINENIYSGDSVSANHLKNQYGLVVGEYGVKRVERLLELDESNRSNNETIRITENQLAAHMRPVMPAGSKVEDFLSLVLPRGIDETIAELEDNIRAARRAKELKAAPTPAHLPVPTETTQLRSLLRSEIEQVSQTATRAVREHIHQQQARARGRTSFEGWLEAGMSAFDTHDDCPFCGQELADRTLVDAYARLFSEAYKSLAAQIATARETLARYKAGDFRRVVTNQSQQNRQTIEYWTEAAKIDMPATENPSDLVDAMESAARALDEAFLAKQSDLTAGIETDAALQALIAWDGGRDRIIVFNGLIDDYVDLVSRFKSSVDEGQLAELEIKLRAFRAAKLRYDPEIVALADKLDTCKKSKSEIAREKAKIRGELNDYEKAITGKLGTIINDYLSRLGAGFSIDYKEPNYQSKEPAASYSILIRNHPVSPRSDGVDVPSFRNTLSAGDKSTLGLAFFLAKVQTDPNLANTIVVLDDPFTSLDSCRRQFTANEIRKLCGSAQQVIVLSHDKNFLRLVWEKVDHAITSCTALQTGAPGITTIAPYDIEAATQPRHVTERVKIEEFLDGEDHEPIFIRTRLRTVCEDFYRKGDAGLFGEAASLEEIIRRLDGAPSDYPYKGALDKLREINEYSRPDSHARIDGNASEETTVEELKAFCRDVIALTKGL